MTYIAIFIIGFFASIRKYSLITFISYTLLLWVLASLRYGVGPDYFAYQDLYLLLSDSPVDEIVAVSTQEPLFRLVGSLMRSFSFSYELYSSVIALISLIYIAITVRKFSQNPILSLLLYYSFFYLVWTYSGIRQGLALSIGTYYFLNCLKTNNKKFYIIVFIITLIHASSIILSLLFYCATTGLRKSTLIGFAVVCIIISFIPLNEYLEYFSFIPYIDRVLFYSNNFNIGSVKIFDFKSISRLAFLIFGFYAFSILKKDELHSRVVAAYIVSFFVYFTLKFSEVLAANLSMYGFILIIIIIPNVYNKLQVNLQNLYSVLTYMVAVLFLLKNLSGMEDMAGLIHTEFITPYTHIFSPNDYQILGPQ